MELHQLKARLALLDMMLNKMNSSQLRIQHIKRTVFVLRFMLNGNEGIPSVYAPNATICQFSLQ